MPFMISDHFIYITTDIHLSNQLVTDKGDQILTSRKQTLSDLIPKLHHHNISARRRRFTSLKE